MTEVGGVMSLFWGVSLLVVGGLLGAFLTTFVKETAKQTAALDAIEKLTRLAEQVKHEFEGARQERAEQHDLRKVAAERRLQALQEAYAISLDLQDEFGSVSKHSEVGRRFWDWWNANCLYLPGEVRTALRASHMAGFRLARRNEQSRAGAAATPPITHDADVQLYNDLYGAREVIERAAQLPPLSIDRAEARRGGA